MFRRLQDHFSMYLGANSIEHLLEGKECSLEGEDGKLNGCSKV